MSPESSIIEELQVGVGLSKEEMGNAMIIFHQLSEIDVKRVMNVGIGRRSDGVELIGMVADEVAGHWLLPVTWILGVLLHCCFSLNSAGLGGNEVVEE